MRLHAVFALILSFALYSFVSRANGTPKEIKLKDGQKFIFIARDNGIEFGSYSGADTVLYSQKAGNLIEQKAYENETKQEVAISLLRSLKTNWKLKANGKNGFPEIFQVSCRPKFSSNKSDVIFGVTYAHYGYDGSRWILKKRVVDGFWENNEKFPDESLFP